jgi:hypothetical protein
MKRIAFLIWFALAGCAFADEKLLDGATLKNVLSDVTLTSNETGRAIEQVFQAGGVTFTVDVESKAQSSGFWRIEGDKYCSQWPPSEHWACYDVLSNEQGVVFVSSNGTRYQMKLPPAD